MPDASISLGLNATEMYGELKTAENKFSAGMDRMGSSNNRLAGSHENLLRSSHRVATQIHNVSRDLLSGASAGDVFASSLEGIARSFNISLGALAGLGVSAVAIQKGYAVLEVYAKLREEIKKVHEESNKSGDFQTLSQLEAAAGSADEAIKKLQDRMSARAASGPTGLWRKMLDALEGSWNQAYLPNGVGAQDPVDQASNYGALDKNLANQLSKRRRRRTSDAREAELNGAPGYESKAAQIKAAGDEQLGAARSLDEMAQIIREVNLAFKELAQTINQKKAERAGRTLGEIAATPSATSWWNADGTVGSLTYDQWQAGNQARQAQSLDAGAESARLAGDMQGAHEGFNAAGEIKEGINGLKPSEKNSSDFKGALQVTEEKLGQIVNNTTGMFAGK